MAEQNGKKPVRATALPYYRWWVQDYRASRAVQRLTWNERGAYRELIDECWDKGGFPDSAEAVAEIVQCEVWEAEQFWPRLRPLFEADEHGLMRSPRLEKERSDSDRDRLLKQAAGRRGGLASGVSRAKQGSSASVLPSGATKHEASSSSSEQSKAVAVQALARVGPLVGLAPAQCPWCGKENGDHAPDCRPSRLTVEDAVR